MQTRAKWLALLAVITLSACGTTRRSAAELDTSRPEPKQTPAPQYPYTWRPRQLPREPACYDAAMCYDEKREVCVLYGGREHHFKQFGSTYNWNGIQWIKPDYWFEPGARCMHAMAYDSQRGAMVLFGGSEDSDREKNDTWQYDSWSAWQLMTPASSPPKRWGHCMAFDRKRGVTVMFGGEGLGPRAFADTWEWDGSNWQERTSGAAPPARLGSLIYDTRQEACLLFTRAQPRKDLDPLGNELWKWDGNTWMRLEPPVMPPLTYNFCMAYDEERRKTVLLLEPHGKAFDPLQTWEFDGTEWRRIATEMTPASREGASISYDARRKRTVLHGGRTWSSRIDDTWLYDGTNWSEHIHVERPTPAGQCAMCYDSARRVTMLLADHWELNQPRVRHWQWDGREWRLVYEFGQDAPAIGGGRLAFDSVRGVAVYLSQDVSRGLDNALWEWDGKSWRKVVSDPEKVPKGGVLWFWNPARSCVSLLYGTFNGDVPAGIGSMWHWNGAKWIEEKLENRITDEGRDWVYGYDSLRNVTIVHCCYVDRGKDEDWKTPGVTATWELRERWWRKVTASREAPKAGNLTLCFCAGSGELVSFGGGYTILADPSTAYNSTWTWNGSEWRQHLTKTTPPGRAGTVMCYDSDRQVIVMFGGNAAHEQLHDTWEYGPDRP